MKKYLIIMVAAIAFCACGSPEKKAQKLIKGYLEENLKDPSSYDPAKFGELDSLFSTFELKNEEFSAKHDMLKAKFDMELALDDFKATDITLKEMNANIEAWKAAEAAFQPQFIGWKMSHRYRAKNGYGALDIADRTFQFDKELTKVTGVE